MKIRELPKEKSVKVKFQTKAKPKLGARIDKWWDAKSDKDTADQLVGTSTYLAKMQMNRQRQASIYARLYGNMSLFNFAGSNISRGDNMKGLPSDRPTFNIVQSSIDTLVSKLAQNRPAPTFLTDNSDYKERNMAKKLNNFILGEFFQTKAYDKGSEVLRDAMVEGTGAVHVFESDDHRVALERVFLTELLIDPSEGIYGEPRRLYRVKLVDREVLLSLMPDKKAEIKEAETANPEWNYSNSDESTSDLVLVVEGWSLPSGKKENGDPTSDGVHAIACSTGILLKEEYKKDKFPFVFMHFSKRLRGFWSQGVSEQLMGTQLEINSLLYTISRAIKLVGVPRVFEEVGSKVLNTSHNNDVGTIIKYQGTKPIYEVAPCVPQELYAQLQRLINYGYQQVGVSQLQAASEKPAGLDSGEAIRTYNDISTDRFAYLSRNYDNFYVELAYQIVDLAKEICEREGKYSTIYPNKNGVKEIDLPKASILDDAFVIQCFNSSSLPRDPAGRRAEIGERIQAGMLTIREGRRLLDFPDTQQIDVLQNASEERIYQYLDDMVEEGKYNPPDPFMDLQLAKDICVQYYNLYSPAKLEEERCEMLRTFFSQCMLLMQAAIPQPPAQEAPIAPPQPMQPSPMVSQVPPQPQ